MKIIAKIRKIPHALWFQYWKQLERITKHINPFWNDAVRYYRITGKKMDWKHPQDMSQKLLWLNRYDQSQLKADCADKYRMKDYVRSCGLDEINVPLIGVWEKPEDIDFEALPDQFALKTNHGCGTNIICSDKSKLDIEDTKRKLREWLQIDFGKFYNEIHYSHIKRCVFAEEFLPSEDFRQLDYKIHCINGEPYCFFFCADRDEEGHATYMTYDLEWNRHDWLDADSRTMERDYKKPQNLAKMIEYARILAKPFPYVRVDFYEVNGRLYIGELTFTPYGNILTYYHEQALEDMGKKLILPKKS